MRKKILKSFCESFNISFTSDLVIDLIKAVADLFFIPLDACVEDNVSILPVHSSIHHKRLHLEIYSLHILLGAKNALRMTGKSSSSLEQL